MKFFPIQSQGYFVNYSKGFEKKSAPQHSFCGTHDIKGALCPNCHKPFLRFLMLDMNDKSFSFKTVHFSKLSILYCWTCAIAQSKFFYQIVGDNEIKILEYKKGSIVKDFPYENYPLFFPRRIALLEKISSREQEIIHRINTGELDELIMMKKVPNLCRPRHQVAGEPYLIQSYENSLTCPECNQRMPFLAAIADDCVDPRGFTGNQFVQALFFYCIECSIVGAMQRCD